MISFAMFDTTFGFLLLSNGFNTEVDEAIAYRAKIVNLLAEY